MCLRNQRNRPHKVEQAMLQDLQDDLDILVNLGNRALLHEVPEPYNDKPIAALSETKHLWKHGQPRRPNTRYRPNNDQVA
jgi:hypothetical protein